MVWPFTTVEAKEEDDGGKRGGKIGKDGKKDDGGKGGFGAISPDLYAPQPGQKALIFMDISNRVQTLCRDYEQRAQLVNAEQEAKKLNDAVIAQLKNLGYVNKGTGSSSSDGLPGDKRPALAGLGLPARKSLKRADSSASDNHNDNNSEEGITTCDEDEVYLSVKKAEAIAKKYECTLVIHENKNKPVAVTDAANSISAHKNYNRGKWLKARNTLCGHNANAGRSLESIQIVASVLVCETGRGVH